MKGVLWGAAGKKTDYKNYKVDSYSLESTFNIVCWILGWQAIILLGIFIDVGIFKLILSVQGGEGQGANKNHTCTNL